MEGGSAFQTPMEGSRSNSIGLGGLQMAPAGTADMNGAARTVDELPVQVRQLVFSIRRFYNAQSGADIDSISSLFAPDAVLDIPVTQMHGRDHIMTTWHFAKQFVDIDMLPKMVTIKMLDPKQAQVSAWWHQCQPGRHCLLPPAISPPRTDCFVAPRIHCSCASAAVRAMVACTCTGGQIRCRQAWPGSLNVNLYISTPEPRQPHYCNMQPECLHGDH